VSRKRIKHPERAAVKRLTGVLGDLLAQGTISFNRRIAGIEKSRRWRDDRDYILPGFIDLQVNGAYGVDVMSATSEELLQVSHCLGHEGTTGWLPTVITSPLDRIERCDAIIAEAMAAQRALEKRPDRTGRALTGAAILGMHLEGPFISPHRRGAHPPLNLIPQGEALERILRLRTLRLITLAPELEGAIDAIRVLTARGIAVSIGHTDASYEEAIAGVQAGARMFTHVFNAMPPLHHRAPGAAGAALTSAVARAAVIPDGVHVHPALLGLTRRAFGPVLTTDRVALAGTEGGPIPLFGGLVREARIENGAARLPDGTLAGSVITMLDGARQVIGRFGDAGLGVGGAFKARRLALMTAIEPARILRLTDRGVLTTRARADLIVLDRELNLKAVFIGGREID
jgi:N-acetylglucosamine-6-phosphate deacetylase